MKSLLIGCLFLISGTAYATIIDFESVKPSDFNYSGFSNLQCSTYFTQDTGYCRGQTTTNGDWVGYTSSTRFIELASPGTFDFYGANITAAWNNGLNVVLQGYNGASLLYTQNFVLDDDIPTWTDSDFFGITRLTVISSGGTDAGTPGGGSYVSWDDIYINEDRITQQIPEPTSLALLGLGLAGFGFMRKKKV